MMSTLPINSGITDVVKAYKFLRGRVRPDRILPRAEREGRSPRLSQT